MPESEPLNSPHDKSPEQTNARGRARLARFGPGAKIVGIAMMVVLMGIPVSLISFVTSDRMSAARSAVYSTADQWGGAWQVLQGPWLIVPHKVSEQRRIVSQRKGCIESQKACEEVRHETREVTRYMVFAPSQLDGKTALNGRLLDRGIHEVPVYDAETEITGRFAALDTEGLVEDGNSRALWDQAFISMVVSDQRTFMDKATLDWSGQALGFEPGVVPPGRARIDIPGIHVRLPRLTPQGARDFTIRLRQKGGLTFGLAPRGQDVTWTMTSNWPDPSFAGRFLPVEREISEAGFSARWSLPSVAHVPQITQNVARLIEAFDETQAHTKIQTHAGAGHQGADVIVNLHQGVDHYSLTNRALKYAVLFIGLVFLTLFLLEIAAGGKPIHPVQYLLVGLANAVFYLLLLAFSENIGFALAYLVAAVATSALIGLYVLAVLSTWRRAMLVVCALIMIYGVLWVILNLEDFALMVGSIVVFTALAITMYATRNIDWYRKPTAPDSDASAVAPAT